jgi:cell division protein FtsA
MAKNFAAIDVGTSKICAILAELDEVGAMRVLGVGIVPSEGMLKGSVVDIDAVKGSIRDSVRMAQGAAGMRISSAYVSITGRHLRSVNNRGTVGIFRRSRMVTAGDVRQAAQATANITIPSDRRLLSIIPRSYTLDGQVEVKDPVGMHGFKLDADAHLITASVTSIRNVLACVRGIGIEVENFIPPSIASSEAVLSDDEKELGVVLADIGGGTTDIAAFRQGRIWYSSSLPVGGYQVTRDISISLGLPYAVAEEAKIRFGDVTPGYAEEGTFTLEEEYTVSYQQLHEVITARVEEILRLIFAEVSSQEAEIVPHAGLVLTGGTANLPGIEALGQAALDLPVKVKLPREISGPADILYDPAYAVSVGLLLWGARHRGEWKAEEIRQTSFIDILRRLFSGRKEPG